jgi:hypothetical protein
MKEQVISIVIGLFLVLTSELADHAFSLGMTRADSLFLGLFSYVISLLTFFGFRLQDLGTLKGIRETLTQVGVQLAEDSGDRAYQR